MRQAYSSYLWLQQQFGIIVRSRDNFTPPLLVTSVLRRRYYDHGDVFIIALAHGNQAYLGPATQWLLIDNPYTSALKLKGFPHAAFVT
ncbi:MAG: hypothetical protein U0930_00880 [Pirellulales bacterium]